MTIPKSLSAEEINAYENQAAEALEKVAQMLRSGEAVLMAYVPGPGQIHVEFVLPGPTPPRPVSESKPEPVEKTEPE